MRPPWRSSKEFSDTPVKSYRVDTGQESSVEELVASAVADMGRVHILINAQGFNVKAPATEFPVADWDKLFMVNVRGVMLCCKHFAKHMVEQGGGKIINLSSIRGARAALGGNLAYCSSKGAIDMMTKQLAVELASKKVHGQRHRADHHHHPDDRRAGQAGGRPLREDAGEHPHGPHGPGARPHRPGGLPRLARRRTSSPARILYPDGGTMAFV